MKYYLIAGEASGDLHASNLMASLKKLDADAEFRYFGGDLMKAQGGALVKHYREMAFMGIIYVVKNLPAIMKNLSLAKEDIASYRPDVVILIDYPGFNLKIAKYVHEKLKIPVHYYISPKVWAWKEYRVKSFKKYVDVMLSILPFEVDFYKQHDYPIIYVGNPTVDAVEDRAFKNESFEEFIKENNLPSKPVIAILAGSRKQEIFANLPPMLEAVGIFSEYQPVIAGAPGIDLSFYQSVMKESPVNIVFNQTYRLLAQSQAALVTSGTATLETALLNTPQVVCYKTAMPKLASWAFENILHTPYISLVNLIAGRLVVKELFAAKFTVEGIGNELRKILQDAEYRQNMLNSYQQIRGILGGVGASERTADIIYKQIKK